MLLGCLQVDNGKESKGYRMLLLLVKRDSLISNSFKPQWLVPKIWSCKGGRSEVLLRSTSDLKYSWGVLLFRQWYYYSASDTIIPPVILLFCQWYYYSFLWYLGLIPTANLLWLFRSRCTMKTSQELRKAALRVVGCQGVEVWQNSKTQIVKKKKT